MSGDASEIPEPDTGAAASDEAILEQMDEVRGKLGGGIDRLNEDMKKVFDWQSYVRSAPLTSVGIAAAVGYLLAPALRSRPIPQFTATTQSVKSGGIFGTIATLALSAVTRLAGHYVTEMLTSSNASTASGTRQAPFTPNTGRGHSSPGHTGPEQTGTGNTADPLDQNFELDL